MSLTFVWDPKKSAANLKKHGVSFSDAAQAFLDPQRMDFYDAAHSSAEEDRWIYLGAAAGTVLFVVQAEPDADTIRIISARRALKREKETYYAGSSDDV